VTAKAGRANLNRWIVALLVAAALFVMVAPGLVGRLAERDLQVAVERAGESSPEVTISTENYRRGWFQSAGRHRIEFSDRLAFPGLARFVDDAGYDNMPALVFDSEIHHGLLPNSAFGEEASALAPGVVNLVSSVSLDPGNGELVAIPGKVFTSIGIDGSARAVVDLEEGTWQADDTAIRWQGVDLFLSTDDGTMLTGARGYVAPVSYSAADFSIDTGRIDIDFARQASVHGLPIGSFRLTSGALRGGNALGPLFGFESADIAAGNRLDGDAVSGNSRVDIKDVTVPGLGVMSIGIDFVFEQLRAAPLGVLVAAYNEAARSGDPQQAVASLYPAHEAELQQLLAGGGEFGLDRLDITYPQGTVVSDLHFSLPAARDGDAFSWPGLLLRMKATMNLTLPTAVYDLISTAYPEANSAVGMGFLIPDGDNYRMNIEYGQGLATVNGMPMPVPLPGN